MAHRHDRCHSCQSLMDWCNCWKCFEWDWAFSLRVSVLVRWRQQSTRILLEFPSIEEAHNEWNKSETTSKTPQRKFKPIGSNQYSSGLPHPITNGGYNIQQLIKGCGTINITVSMIKPSLEMQKTEQMHLKPFNQFWSISHVLDL